MKNAFRSTLASAALLALAGSPACNSLSIGKPGAEAAGKSADRSKLADEPDVTFTDLQGKSVSLASFKGKKAVLVNFWATWCEPCRVEIPWLIESQQKYGDKGFTVLGVAMDDEGKSVVEPYVQKEKFDVAGKPMTMNYPIVIGNDDIAQKFGGLIGFPTSLLVSKDGKIIKRFIGIVNRDQLVKEIEGQL